MRGKVAGTVCLAHAFQRDGSAETQLSAGPAKALPLHTVSVR
jgi:hypothetical protein